MPLLVRPVIPALVACSLTALTGHAAQQGTRFVAVARGVVLDVLVTDRNRPVSGLRVEDFEVRDNGVRQAIESIEISNAPLNAVLVLDTSASTAGGLLTSLTAGTRPFLAGLVREDRVGFVAFSHAVRTRSLAQVGTQANASLDQAIPAGGSALRDAIYAALTLVRGVAGRPVLVVYTDGRDTASWLSEAELTDELTRSDAVVYFVVPGGAERRSILSEMSSATGGRIVPLTNPASLAHEIQQIIHEFRSRYLITFVPRGVEPSGVHRLDVRVKPQGLQVIARNSYSLASARQR